MNRAVGVAHKRGAAVLTLAAASLGLVLSSSTVAAAVPSAPTTDHAYGSCRTALRPGENNVAVTLAGTTYQVLVYAPKTTKPTVRTKLPLVLDLHGSQNNATLQLELSDMARVADANGFIVAAPNGAVALPPEDDIPGDIYAWNVPGVTTVSGTPVPANTRDDVRFLSKVVSTLKRTACVDRSRVYGTGYSGGGRMISALACAQPDLLAAIAPVSGLRAGRPSTVDPTVPDLADCAHARPTPVLTFQGEQDPVNPFGGGGAAYWQYSVPVALQAWARIDKCTVGPVQSQVSEHVVLQSYRGCAGRTGVSMYKISDGGHTWPGSPAYFPDFLGKVSQEINASDLMWSFFKEYRS